MVRNLLSATLMVAMLTGLQACVVYDEPGRPDRPDVVIRHDDNDYYPHRQRGYKEHCPPGHRKKHWC